MAKFGREDTHLSGPPISVCICCGSIGGTGSRRSYWPTSHRRAAFLRFVASLPCRRFIKKAGLLRIRAFLRLDTAAAYCLMSSLYELLAVARSATQADIKAAYHRRLLAAHPDKRISGGRQDGTTSDTDIAITKTPRGLKSIAIDGICCHFRQGCATVATAPNLI